MWRAKVTPYWHWHVLYREHLAADLVLALAHLEGLLARRLADHVAAWQPPPATLALRQPCPHRTDPDGRAMIDLLLVRPDPADDPDGAFDAQAAALVEALPHWTGNHVHDHVLAKSDAGEDDELADGSWWLLAGRRVPGLAFTDPPQPPSPGVSWPAGLSAPTP